MCRFKLSLKRLLKRIEKADELEINEIIFALIRWQRRANPDYEIAVLTLSTKDIEYRNKQIDWAMDSLRKHIAAGETMESGYSI